jgi:hypothetical protein
VRTVTEKSLWARFQMFPFGLYLKQAAFSIFGVKTKNVPQIPSFCLIPNFQKFDEMGQRSIQKTHKNRLQGKCLSMVQLFFTLFNQSFRASKSRRRFCIQIAPVCDFFTKIFPNAEKNAHFHTQTKVARKETN